MNIFEIEKHGPPDIKIAGLQIWVHGYEFAEADNNDDRNWLKVTVHCGASGATVWATGSILQASDIVMLASESEKLYQNKIEELEMAPLEPELRILIKSIDELGHLELTVEITPDHLTQDHTFQFDIDQSYLPSLVGQCRKLLERFPYRNR